MDVTVRLFDNGGETIDRYTAIFVNEEGYQYYLGMSEYPFHPQGVGMHGDDDVSGVLERDQEIEIETAPEQVRKAISQEIDWWTKEQWRQA